MFHRCLSVHERGWVSLVPCSFGEVRYLWSHVPGGGGGGRIYPLEGLPPDPLEGLPPPPKDCGIWQPGWNATGMLSRYEQFFIPKKMSNRLSSFTFVTKLVS